MIGASLISNQGPLARLWRSYETQLERRPIATQSVTSALLWGAGDLLAQRFADKEARSVDVRRTALTAVFGGSLIGPCGHVWYSQLDKLALLFGPTGSARFLLAKIMADSTLWNVFYMSAFFLWGEVVIDKGNLKSFAAQMQEEFVPTYLAEVAAWPPIMAAIFTRLPTSHHLLAVNLITVLDVAFLAVIRSGAFSLTDHLPSGPQGHLQEEKESSSILIHEQILNMLNPGRAGGIASAGMDGTMVPALASMHTTAAGRSKARVVSAAAPLQAAGADDTAHMHGSAFTRVIEAGWVLPEHRNMSETSLSESEMYTSCSSPRCISSSSQRSKA